MQDLQEFLAYYLAPGTDLTEFLAAFERQEVKKGKFLVQPGQYCDWMAFIRKGVSRVYFHDANQQEVTLWISFQEMVSTNLWAFYTGERSWAFVQILEDAELFFIRKQQLDDLYDRRPEYRLFGQKFAEEAFTMLMRRTLELQTLTPEQRYLNLLEQPEFMQKIPLKYLATWLGVTDTSLSRIRRKIKAP